MSNSTFTTIQRGKVRDRQLLVALIFLLLTGISSPAYSQQFNSDNWWMLPVGVGMGIATIGERYSIMYLGYGFAKDWEIDIAPTIYSEDKVTGTAARYSTTAYVKHLLWENQVQTGGVAVMAGIGQSPGYYQAGIKTEDFESYWATFPWTVPLFDNTISWDIMPGVTYNKEYGINKVTATGLSYSTRVAIYKIIPKSSIVGEVFGVTGEAKAQPQYKVGVRYESKYLVAALSYGDGLEDNRGAGWEIGIMVFTLPWF